MRVSMLFIMLAISLFLLDIAVAATLHGSIYDIELNELNDVVVEVDSEPRQRYVSKEGTYSFELNPGEYTITAMYRPDKIHEYTTTENILIRQEGDYVYDLFLFPGFDTEGEDMLDEPDPIRPEDIDVDVNGGRDGLTVAIIAVSAVILLLILYFIIGHYRNKEEKEELKEVERAKKQARESLKEELDAASMRKRPGKPKKTKKRNTHAAHDKQGRSKKQDKPHETAEDTDLEKVIEIIKKEGGRTTQKELRKQIPYSEAKISLMVTELEDKGMVKKVKKGRGNIIILERK